VAVEGQDEEISGLLYKRRGGLAKFVPNPWHFRFFTLSKEGMLCYYDNECPVQISSDVKPRGKLDLAVLNCEFKIFFQPFFHFTLRYSYRIT
jgi:hypothetical protein